MQEQMLIFKSRLAIAIAIIMLSCAVLQAFSPVRALAEEAEAVKLDHENNAATPSGIPYAQLEAVIDRFVEPLIGLSTPGAAIVITKGDRILFSKGYGYANLEEKIPVDPASTVFAYGSISKLFVWTSAMQLVEQGKMALDTDIRDEFSEDFRGKLRADKPFTLLDLMSHTAGFEEYGQSAGSAADKAWI